jgi:putative heme-binding domain-containing protein
MTVTSRIATLVVAFSLPSVAGRAGDAVDGLKVPAGFSVTEYAGPDLANDIYCLHVSARGEVVVAGRGYVRELIDSDGDGRADQATELVTGLRDGPMGVLLEGDVLFVVADGGLKRYRFRGGVPADADTGELVLAARTVGEHDAHAVRRGPDGWLYLLCGNMAGVSEKTITSPASPVKKPVAGCLLRIRGDGRRVEVLADGFRNPYDFDFNPAGDAFTFDSDNERCVGLPWYEPTRFYHVVPGGHYGWLSPQLAQTWRRPAYFWDVVPPVAAVGRGSPTGVCCYRHTAFPERYHGGFYLADWTFGRVVFISPQQVGAGYTGVPEPFVQAVGDSGFAPTGLAVHPRTGDLFVSTGGRGTRGVVYRIRHIGRQRDGRPSPFAEGQEPSQAELRVRVVSDRAPVRLRALLTVERRVAELGENLIAEAVRANVGHDDRLIRQAAARLAAQLPAESRTRVLACPQSDTGSLTLGFASVAAAPAEAGRTALAVLASRTTRAADRLDAVRLLQLSFGDLTNRSAVGGVFEGYTARRDLDRAAANEAAAVIRSALPSGNTDLDRELARMLAMLADDHPDSFGKVASALTARSDPLGDVHNLSVLARLRSPRTADQTRAVADALLRLEEKVARQGVPRDRHWPLRVSESAAALTARDSKLPAALVESPGFGLPGHIVFAKLPGMDRRAAARRFLARGRADPEFEWRSEHAALLGELPPAEVRDLLSSLWDRGGLEDALLPLFARHPEARDRERFVTGLRSTSPAAVATAAKALRPLPPGGGKELAALVRALRAIPAAESHAVKELTATLRSRTGTDFGTDAKLWSEWVARNHPEAAKELLTEGAGAAGLRKRLAGIDWAIGDAAAGRKAFAKASCSACHNGSQAVGPSLDGAASRFNRDDLIAAVIDPNRDVPARYRVTKVTTDDGKVYQGVVIYEANDGLILQTGATETVRVAVPRVSDRQSLDTSPMPAGLLDPLTDREIADLFAYLKTLGKPTKP